MIALIAAHSANRVIGNKGKIPWHLPEDFKLFKKYTLGNTVIMGRKTWESLPEKVRPLPERENIIVSTTLKHIEGAQVFDSLEKALEYAKTLNKDIFIMGGASLYEKAINFVDKMYLSEVYMECEGDTFFPEFDKTQWEVEYEKEYEPFMFRIWKSA